MARSAHPVAQVDGVKPGAIRDRPAQLGDTRLDVRVHSHRQHPTNQTQVDNRPNLTRSVGPPIALTSASAIQRA